MQAAVPQRQSVKVGTALAMASVVAVTSIAPVTPWPSAMSVVDRAVRLAAAGDSILNIPFNLFQDIVNIPNNEVEGLNVLADSLFFSGNWFTPSATNIWGEDPGDPGHFLGLTDIAVPFPQISGLGTPEIDPTADAAGTAGLGQQLALLAAAEIPVSASCDADSCLPLVPTTPITGISSIDRNVWFLETLTGAQKFPLFNNWFTVPLSDLAKGYQFDAANDPGIVDPSQGVGPGGSVPSEFGLSGTVPGPDGENLMPWANTTFTLNLLEPFQNFYNSLLASPNLNGFEVPSLEDLGRAMQSLLAAEVVAFDPYVAASPACIDECILPPASTTEGIVQSIGNLWPGNPLINQWLTDTADGTANEATPHQIQVGIDYLQGQQNSFDFGNPPPSEPLPGTDTPDPVPIGPVGNSLIQFAQASGIQGFDQALADLFGFNPSNNPGGFLEGEQALWVALIGPFLGAGSSEGDVSPLLDAASLDPLAWLTPVGSLFF